MRRALILALISLPLAGQSGLPNLPESFATTADGSQLYFISGLVLRGSTGESNAPKLFRYDGSSFSLVAQVAPILQPGTPAGYSDLLEPRVSGDGTVFGYVASQGCGNSCNLLPGQGYQTTLQFPGAAAPLTLPYYCQISANARYALCVTGQPSLQQVAIADLSTGQMSAPQLTVCHDKYLIASTGRALVWNQQQMFIFDASGVQQIPGTTYFCPVISDDGSEIVYASHGGLIAYNVAAGTQTALTPPCQVCDQAGPSSISSDGTLVLAGGMLFHTDGSGAPATLEANSGAAMANLLSGDGTVAYAAFIKFDLLHNQITSFLLPPPSFSIFGATVPGSEVMLMGQYLAGTSAAAGSFPGPTSLAGVQVNLNGTPVPLISASPTLVSFQLPWELQPGSATLDLVTTVQSQFVAPPLALQISSYSPVLEANAITEDFSAVITNSNAANPGDIVNFYLTGLGSVVPAGIDSTPSPASPLPLLANPITISYSSMPLHIYYAGLAPGLIGIYQVTVQTPSQVTAIPHVSGPRFVGLSLQSSSQQSAVPFTLGVWMNPNQ